MVQGFRREEEFTIDRFKQVNMKTLYFLPDSSSVRIYYLIKNIIISKLHDCLKIYGGFLKKGELFKSSINFKKKLDKFFKDNNIINPYDLLHIKFDSLVNMFNDIKELDTKDLFIDLIQSVFFTKK